MVVRKTAVKILITGGVIVGVILIAQRFGIGGRIIGGFGDLAGVLTEGPLQFIKVFAEGAGKIGEEAVKVSENFQRSLSGGLLLSEQELFGGGGFVGGTITLQRLTTQPGQTLPAFLQSAFKAFPTQPQPTTSDSPAGSSIFDIASQFTRQAQEFRLSGGNVTSVGGTSAFGGFGTPIAQESALQKALAKSRQLFPQFFKV